MSTPITQIFSKMDTNAPRFGSLVDLINITPSGYNYIVNNRIKVVIREIINEAIEMAKLDVIDWIRTYWAKDTSKTIDQAIKYIEKRKFTDLSESFGLFIGADEEYFQYVLSMSRRMRAKGKSVNWSNPNTALIEDDILGETSRYATQRLKHWISEGLKNANLGWMTGTGRIPKKPSVNYNERIKYLKKYYSKYKPIKFV